MALADQALRLAAGSAIIRPPEAPLGCAARWRRSMAPLDGVARWRRSMAPLDGDAPVRRPSGRNPGS
jgi:hypothetical protein